VISRRLWPITRRAVRNLEREIARSFGRWRPRSLRPRWPRRSRVTPTDLVAYLGRPKFFFEAAERTSVPGVATGLAVTEAGGDVLFVEAAAMEHLRAMQRASPA